MDTSEVERLVAYAERPRHDGWTLRSALVRYAQLAPERASVVLELIRRTDGSLAHLDGHPDRADDDDRPTLAVAALLDRVGDVLTAWAVERGDAPHDEVESQARRAAEALTRLGIERERDPRAGRRGRG